MYFVLQLAPALTVLMTSFPVSVHRCNPPGLLNEATVFHCETVNHIWFIYSPLPRNLDCVRRLVLFFLFPSLSLSPSNSAGKDILFVHGCSVQNVATAIFPSWKLYLLYNHVKGMIIKLFLFSIVSTICYLFLKYSSG